jgi:DNA-binding YbaB/EbfC family protein
MAMNMQQIMQQARKMQEQLADAQDHLKDIEVSASAGGGMVKVTATADGVLTSLKIDPEALDPEDVELIEDTIVAAVNEVLASAQEVARQQMGAITGGMGLPGMF